MSEMLHINHLLTNLHEHMPDLSPDDMADVLWFALRICPLGDGGRVTGDGGRGTGDRGLSSGDGGPGTGDRGLSSGDGGPGTEDRGLSSGDGGPGTGDRGLSSGDGGPASVPGLPSPVPGLPAPVPGPPSGAPVYVADSAAAPTLPAMPRLTIHVPGAYALPDRLDLARALRPLKRRVPSHTQHMLDEEATVRRVADMGLWSPVLRPARSRWFDIALVVDTSASMAIWQQAITELRHLLAYHGAFRDVRTWQLATEDMPSRPHLYQHQQQHPTPHAAMLCVKERPVRPQALINLAEQRLIIVVSDCVAPAWYNGTVANMLGLWGRIHPVVIVQMLPQHLWSRCGLDKATDVYVQARTPGIPNMRLNVLHTTRRRMRRSRQQPTDAPHARGARGDSLNFPPVYGGARGGRDKNYPHPHRHARARATGPVGRTGGRQPSRVEKGLPVCL